MKERTVRKRACYQKNVRSSEIVVLISSTLRLIILSFVMSAEVVYLLPRHCCLFKVFLNCLYQFMCIAGKRLIDSK